MKTSEAINLFLVVLVNWIAILSLFSLTSIGGLVLADGSSNPFVPNVGGEPDQSRPNDDDGQPPDTTD